MNSDHVLSWVAADGSLHELTMPTGDALEISLGRAVASYGWHLEVFDTEAALARINGEIEALLVENTRIERRRDELVNEHPALKAKEVQMDKMHIAVRSGFLVNEDGELREITRGRDRVATEVLDRCPAYEEFFDRCVTTKTFGGRTRMEGRATDSTGKVWAVEFPE